METVGVILSMIFTISCSTFAGLALGTYFIKKNNSKF